MCSRRRPALEVGLAAEQVLRQLEVLLADAEDERRDALGALGAAVDLRLQVQQESDGRPVVGADRVEQRRPAVLYLSLSLSIYIYIYIHMYI